MIRMPHPIRQLNWSLMLFASVIFMLLLKVNQGSLFGGLHHVCAGWQSGTVPHPSLCNKYIECVGGQAWLVRPCPVGTLFDQFALRCNHAQYVNCNGRSSYSGDFYSSSYTDSDTELEFYTTALADVPVNSPVAGEGYPPSSSFISPLASPDSYSPYGGFGYRTPEGKTVSRKIRPLSLLHHSPSGLWEVSEDQSDASDETTSSEGAEVESAAQDEGQGDEDGAQEYVASDAAFTFDDANVNGDKIVTIQEVLSQLLPSMRRDADDHFYRQRNLANQVRAHQRPFRFVQSLLGNTMQGVKISLSAYLQLHCLKALQQRFGLTKDEMEAFLRRVKRIPGLIKHNGLMVAPDDRYLNREIDVCPFPQNSEHDCDWHANFRTFDGSCNNMRYPLKGKAMRAFRRALDPDYGDGVSSPRLGYGGHALPSARKVSRSVHVDVKSLSAIITSMHMTFGQFLDHDFGRTAVTKLMNDRDEMINVQCGTSGCETAGAENEACLPIMLPPDDEAWSVRPCLMFVRSQAVLKDDCKVGPREQLNQVTSYIDASIVYGSSWNETMKLRDLYRMDRGRLRVTPHPDRKLKPLLPQMAHKDCRDNNTRIQCFTAGDTRVNEQVALMAMHTVFHRYHNHIEERLHELNPHWSGDRLFQETRKILIGVWQHVVYNEYLPPTLGPSELRRYGLTLQRSGFWDGYDPDCNPDTLNTMQTAAFRFGHSQVTGSFHLTDYKYSHNREVTFSEVFNRPYEIYNTHTPGGSGVDAIIFGQISQQAESTDQFFSEQVTRKLFSERPPLIPGTDLPALNIQRGRDHGLPSYVKWRKWCDLSVPTSFNDLEDMPEEAILRLQSVYRRVEDIDLFAAAMCEHRLRTSMLGPTFACIIGRQFRAFRVGDRFWYERSDKLVGFTQEQLTEIRKATIARILCDTMDYVQTIQKFVMLQPLKEAIDVFGANDAYLLQSLYRGDDNERRPCSEIPDVDLSYWAEEPPDYQSTWYEAFGFPSLGETGSSHSSDPYSGFRYKTVVHSPSFHFDGST